MKVLVLIIILSNIFNILDTLTTVYAVKVLGYEEANIFMRKILSKSVECYVVFKILSLVIVSIIAIKTMNILDSISYFAYLGAFSFMLIVLCFAVLNNLYQIFVSS